MTTGDSNPLPHPVTYNLDPLRDGPHALATHDTPPILKAKLRAVEIAQENARHHILIHQADDVFNTPHHPNPIPATGPIAAATFDLQCEAIPDPVIADVRLPHTLRVSHQAALSFILAWLQKRQLAKLANLTLLILSAILTPVVDDSDDSDDTDPDHITHFAA